MQIPGIKKFFLDYLVGTGLITALFLLLVVNITGMDARALVELKYECSVPFPADDVLQQLQTTLKIGESCEIVSPCMEWQVVQCTGTESVFGLYQAVLKGESLLKRANNSLKNSYSVLSYKDRSLLRINHEILLILLAYGLILAEAGALLYALWRQGMLKQTLTLPAGSRADHVFKPAFWASMFALIILLTNYFVFTLFDHPETQLDPMKQLLMESWAGVVIAIFFAPLAEELIFRGVILRFFVERDKALLGTLLVSMLFSVVHGFQEPGLGWQLYVSLIYFVISAILCWLYIKQKNLWSPIVFHCVYNSTLILVYYVLS